MHRLLVVGRIDPAAESRIADIFANADSTDLPTVAGTRHRSLYRLQDLFLHLIEADNPAPFRAAQGHPAFAEVGRRLPEYVAPYLPTLTSPADAMASCFYRWDAPVAVPR